MDGAAAGRRWADAREEEEEEGLDGACRLAGKVTERKKLLWRG